MPRKNQATLDIINKQAIAYHKRQGVALVYNCHCEKCVTATNNNNNNNEAI